MAELDSNKAGMGTTISAMMSLGSHAVTAQVGDSRIYRLRNSKAEQLTEDHTLINWQIKQGLITEDQLRIGLTEQKTNNTPIGRQLVRLGFVTEAAIRDAMARTVGQESIDLSQVQVPFVHE